MTWGVTRKEETLTEALASIDHRHTPIYARSGERLMGLREIHSERLGSIGYYSADLAWAYVHAFRRGDARAIEDFVEQAKQTQDYFQSMKAKPA